MLEDPLQSYGLQEINLDDKPVFDRFFHSCQTPLSDYTFANTFIWREPIHLRWRVSRDCLCVFANGDGGLTLLFPPLGEGDFAGALGESLEICDAYNTATCYEQPTRVEYVSAALLPLFADAYRARPMSGDYIYATRRMIELDGPDLASKRKGRSRFARLYQARTETFHPGHLPQCIELLKTWHNQAETSTAVAAQDSTVQLKRAKEETATLAVLTHAEQLGLTGMVLYASDQLVGFTFGERLGPDTCSIIIEKTDRQFKGAAQYIFSEFCRQYWTHTPWCNVGDDWEIPSLAWTKESYRPVARREKWTILPRNAATAIQSPTATPAGNDHEPSDSD
jgi:hypothetical protein